MRLTITNDEGEVYVLASNVRQMAGTWVADDEEDDTETVSALLQAAAKWEEVNA